MVEPRSHSMRRTVVVALALLAATATALPAAHARPAAAGTDADATKVRQDFNGDGYEDLAVGAAAAKVGGMSGAGYVAVLYGSAGGLNTGNRKVYTQASPGVPGTVEAHDRFGARLAAADLDGDGFTDLLVESDNEQWEQNGIARDGNRTVLWGSRAGFTSGKVLPALTGSKYQGGRTVTGDFNGDGHQDLAGPDDVRFGPFGRDGVARSVQQGAEFVDDDVSMTALEAGDVDGDGITDLVALGRHGFDENYDYTYSLHYVRGSRDGLRPPVALDGVQFLSDDSWNDGLALGDLDGDRRAEIVAGGGDALRILRGTANGPDDTTAPRTITQDTPGVPGAREEGDAFGHAVAIGDVDGDGHRDILVGNPHEDLDGVSDAGTFAVVPGGPDGPTGAGTKVLSQNSASVPGAAEFNDLFGFNVHLVDGDGDGRAEPVVAAVLENASDGAVWAFRSTSTGVTATGSFSFGSSTLGMVAKAAGLGRSFPR
ncbi:VCBS repeat-containing protein [Streptomyces luteolifulvus]|uniref:VCBS repeat-containing protein n=2 Tax=Streptomyces luteolifulvus TaxID=2615112 RepID=A0A6H9V1P3_9ACTN|nr:VCBS repeat-containing protein [Streptomyces luteolifulvus]